jgi:high-affinity Fe2+/Pb2+ permease
MRSDAFAIVLHAVLAALACATVVGWLLYRTVRPTQAKIRALPEWFVPSTLWFALSFT